VRSLPDGCGPATKIALRGLCRSEKQRQAFPKVMREMLDSGELVIRGVRKGARYGLPKKRKPSA